MASQVFEEQQRSVQPVTSKVADVVTPISQADWGQEQRQSPWVGDQQKQELSQTSSGSRSELQGPSPRLCRLPLPKLKSLVRPKSIPDQSVESGRMTNFDESVPSQILQKFDYTPSPSSSNNGSVSTMVEQEDSRSSTGFRCGHPDSENNSGNDRFVRKSVPKLNLIGRCGLFKMSMDKVLVERQPGASGDVSCDLKNKQVSTQHRHVDDGSCQQEFSDAISPQLEAKVSRGISVEQEHLALKSRVDKVHIEDSHPEAFNEQAHSTVPTQVDQPDQYKDADQDCGKESDMEEKFYDAVGDDVAGPCENNGDVCEVAEGMNYDEADVPPTSSESTSPRITPGFILTDFIHLSIHRCLKRALKEI